MCRKTFKRMGTWKNPSFFLFKVNWNFRAMINRWKFLLFILCTYGVFWYFQSSMEKIRDRKHIWIGKGIVIVNLSFPVIFFFVLWIPTCYYIIWCVVVCVSYNWLHYFVSVSFFTNGCHPSDGWLRVASCEINWLSNEIIAKLKMYYKGCFMT